jgi:hypothetical protein
VRYQQINSFEKAEAFPDDAEQISKKTVYNWAAMGLAHDQSPRPGSIFSQRVNGYFSPPRIALIRFSKSSAPIPLPNQTSKTSPFTNIADWAEPGRPEVAFESLPTSLGPWQPGAKAPSWVAPKDWPSRFGDLCRLAADEQLLLDICTSQSFVAPSWFPVCAKHKR